MRFVQLLNNLSNCSVSRHCFFVGVFVDNQLKVNLSLNAGCEKDSRNTEIINGLSICKIIYICVCVYMYMYKIV